MKRNQNGFSAMEFVLILVVICLLTVSGYYIWHKSHHASPITPAATKSTTKTTIKNYTTITSDWQTYKSPNSTLHFMYPPDWQLSAVQYDNNNPKSPDILESYKLKGPNGFDIYYELVDATLIEKMRTNTSNSCSEIVRYQPVVLNAEYEMVPEATSSSTGTGNPNSIFLAQTKNKLDPGSSCENSIDYFTVLDNKGGFELDGRSPKSYPLSQFLSLPEVQTAKLIFSTVQQ